MHIRISPLRWQVLFSQRERKVYLKPLSTYILSTTYSYYHVTELLFPVHQDVPEVLAKMASPAWSERKEGLFGLQMVLQSSRVLSRAEIKRVTELFTRMFADPHSKVGDTIKIQWHYDTR